MTLERDPLLRLSTRVQAIGRVASKATGDAAAALTAQGRDVLALNGSPWWAPPEHVLAAAIDEEHRAPAGSLQRSARQPVAPLARGRGRSDHRYRRRVEKRPEVTLRPLVPRHGWLG